MTVTADFRCCVEDVGAACSTVVTDCCGSLFCNENLEQCVTDCSFRGAPCPNGVNDCCFANSLCQPVKSGCQGTGNVCCGELGSDCFDACGCCGALVCDENNSVCVNP